MNSTRHAAGKRVRTSMTGSAPRRKSPQRANAPSPPDRSHTHAKIEECLGPDPGPEAFPTPKPCQCKATTSVGEGKCQIRAEHGIMGLRGTLADSTCFSPVLDPKRHKSADLLYPENHSLPRHSWPERNVMKEETKRFVTVLHPKGVPI